MNRLFLFLLFIGGVIGCDLNKRAPVDITPDISNNKKKPISGDDAGRYGGGLDDLGGSSDDDLGGKTDDSVGGDKTGDSVGGGKTGDSVGGDKTGGSVGDGKTGDSVGGGSIGGSDNWKSSGGGGSDITPLAKEKKEDTTRVDDPKKKATVVISVPFSFSENDKFVSFESGKLECNPKINVLKTACSATSAGVPCTGMTLETDASDGELKCTKLEFIAKNKESEKTKMSATVSLIKEIKLNANKDEPLKIEIEQVKNFVKEKVAGTDAVTGCSISEAENKAINDPTRTATTHFVVACMRRGATLSECHEKSKLPMGITCVQKTNP